MYKTVDYLTESVFGAKGEALQKFTVGSERQLLPFLCHNRGASRKWLPATCQPCESNGGIRQNHGGMCSKEKMNRRNFLKLIGIGGTAALAPATLFAKSDVRGWRFGVWELQYIIYPGNYWARCDCGTEQAVGLDKLLSMDALSCDHVRHRGFFSLGPDSPICQNCGGHRRFFFNGDGFRIWRCGNCEEADIRAYLRREYGPATSVQFTANMRKTNVNS